jgi:hypothetical protein
MASAALAPQPATPDHKTEWTSRLFSPAVVESWWLGIPRKLRSYSRLLGAAWLDGIYLSARPRVAVALPLAVLLFGFLEGATHWSPLTIGSSSLSTSIPAVAFLQIFHLLFIAVALGSLSANLGLMLVIGFAAGDYLVAGPVLSLGPSTPISGFFYLRLPQLYSYALFLALAVAPTVMCNAFLTPFALRFPTNNLPWVTLRVAASTVVQMLLVYGWTLLAPITLRVMWSWAGAAPPLALTDYRSMLNPWLPLAAGIAVVARAFLVRRKSGDPLLKDRIRRLRQEARQADQKPKWTRRLPVWLRAVLTALACTLLLSGLIASWWLAALVCAALVCICLVRNCVLPGSGWWMKWARTIDRVPVIFRLAAMVAATYFATLELLQLPGWSAGANGNPGHFEPELASVGVGLLISMILLPYMSGGSDAKGKPLLPSLPASTVQASVKVLLILSVLFTSAQAYATCLDPACCFGNNNDAAMAVGILALGIGIILIAGAALAVGVAIEAAAAESAAAVAADAALAEGAEISPLARTISPLAKSIFP